MFRGTWRRLQLWDLWCEFSCIAPRSIIVAAALEAMQRSYQGIDICMGIVHCPRRPYGGLKPTTPQDRLRAVVTRTHRNAFAVQRATYLFGSKSFQRER